MVLILPPMQQHLHTHCNKTCAHPGNKVIEYELKKTLSSDSVLSRVIADLSGNIIRKMWPWDNSCNSLGTGIYTSIPAADLIMYGTGRWVFVVSGPATVFWRILNIPFIECIENLPQRAPVGLELHKPTPLSPKAVTDL